MKPDTLFFTTYDTHAFVQRLQKLLDQPHFITENPSYLDLSQPKEVSITDLQNAANSIPHSDPITIALGIILHTMERGPFILTKIGINELLKSYLLQVQTSNEEACTHCYLGCIYQIYLFGLLETYPYTDLLWDYLSRCFATVSKYLVEHKLIQASYIYLNKVSMMGKWAAQKGLHTSSIQHSLHSMETRAREAGFTDLADTAKNYRFNLETF